MKIMIVNGRLHAPFPFSFFSFCIFTTSSEFSVNSTVIAVFASCNLGLQMMRLWTASTACMNLLQYSKSALLFLSYRYAVSISLCRELMLMLKGGSDGTTEQPGCEGAMEESMALFPAAS